VYRGIIGVAPLVTNLCAGRRWVVKFTPRPVFPPGKDSGIHLLGRWEEPKGQYRRFGEEENLFPLSEFKPRIVQPVRQVSISTTQSVLN